MTFSDPDGDKASFFGSDAFKRKSHPRFRIAEEVLRLYVTAFIIHLDVIFLKNPFSVIDLTYDWDVLGLYEPRLDLINCGLYLVRPTPASFELFARLRRYNRVVEDPRSECDAQCSRSEASPSS